MKITNRAVALMLAIIFAAASYDGVIGGGPLMAQVRTQPPQQTIVVPRGPATLVAPGGPTALNYCCSSCPGTGQGSQCTQAGGANSCQVAQCFLSCACGETVQDGGVTCHAC
jgi:hypothetical protein